MATAAIVERARIEGWSDEEVVDRVRAGDTALFEVIMRRYNQRLYRVARAILRNDSEAEDVIQDAYVRAYQHLDQFERRARACTPASARSVPGLGRGAAVARFSGTRRRCAQRDGWGGDHAKRHSGSRAVCFRG